ncbi:MAG: hypothetical protein M3Z05_07785 [Gemmatimonadota bacterium]|nr:hypothetical protein [Gemmatimonadota bacterium]
MPTALRFLSVVALIALPACAADITTPSGADLASAVQGSWVAEQAIPGNSLDFTLRATDTTVTGGGAFAGEAGPAGTVAITGDATLFTLTLHFSYTATVPAPATSVARFVGTLDKNDRLVGSMKYGPEAGEPPEYPIVFRRLPQLPH